MAITDNASLCHWYGNPDSAAPLPRLCGIPVRQTPPNEYGAPAGKRIPVAADQVDSQRSWMLEPSRLSCAMSLATFHPSEVIRAA
jgi:hypothetical protein